MNRRTWLKGQPLRAALLVNFFLGKRIWWKIIHIVNCLSLYQQMFNPKSERSWRRRCVLLPINLFYHSLTIIIKIRVDSKGNPCWGGVTSSSISENSTMDRQMIENILISWFMFISKLPINVSYVQKGGLGREFWENRVLIHYSVIAFVDGIGLVQSNAGFSWTSRVSWCHNISRAFELFQEPSRLCLCCS